MTVTRALAEGEHALIGDIIGESFADDPVNRWVFGGRGGMTAYYSLVAKKLYLRTGFGHAAGNAGGTLWLPPGVSKDIPLWNSLDIATALLRHSGPRAIFRGLAVDASLARSKPSQPYFYLFAIGVRPAEQGKGVGRRLMSAGLEAIDRAGLPAYLESSKESNLPFYRHFGFEVIAQVEPARGCPPMWLMWRDSGHGGTNR